MVFFSQHVNCLQSFHMYSTFFFSEKIEETLLALLPKLSLANHSNAFCTLPKLYVSPYCRSNGKHETF